MALKYFSNKKYIYFFLIFFPFFYSNAANQHVYLNGTFISKKDGYFSISAHLYGAVNFPKNSEVIPLNFEFGTNEIKSSSDVLFSFSKGSPVVNFSRLSSSSEMMLYKDGLLPLLADNAVIYYGYFTFENNDTSFVYAIMEQNNMIQEGKLHFRLASPPRSGSTKAEGTIEITKYK